MYDVALIHPPSVFDFRKMNYTFASPISDVVPSMPVFDMYPLGFFSLATYLEERGVKTGIFNLAALMLLDENFDAIQYLKSIKAQVYAIDLHWLVHAHGAIEVARLIKELHDAPVVLGGLSTTYYWHELLEKYPWIDYLFLGDSTENAFYQFYEFITKNRKVSEIPNLAYRNPEPKANTIIAPAKLDEYRPKYDIITRVFAQSGIENALPWAEFLKDPIVGIITYKGCLFNCITCGGSNFAYQRFRRTCLGFKSPKAVFDEFKEIIERLKVPVFFIGDLQALGRRYIEELMISLRNERADVPLIFEFFYPPNEELLRLYRSAGERVLVQISPEDPDETTRIKFGRRYTNSILLKFAKNASIFDRVDYYFMVGLPDQRPKTNLGSFYIGLYKATSNRANAFVAPLAPFIDPGSLAFENPNKYGYKILARTLEEHRELLTKKPWYMMLNYETEFMDRRALAKATYDAAYDLAKAKVELGQLDEKFLEELELSCKNL
ncbi:MAG TPA: TIGR04190 family B12-binding domain/radical SAM domain protein, partial [Geobacterales bacterium]|nr:TIGR04190 family B12-binding domain/radical SAM domain protein [Geobacterales bacterium]